MVHGWRSSRLSKVFGSPLPPGEGLYRDFDRMDFNMSFPPAQRRQLKIGVTFLAWLNIYQNLKQAIQDVIAPEMQQLRGDIKALSAEIAAVRQELTLFQTVVNRQFDTIDKRFDAVDKRFDAVDKRFDALKDDIDKRFDAAGDAVHTRFEAMDRRLDGIDKRIDGLAADWRVSLDVHERLAAIEARLEKR